MRSAIRLFSVLAVTLGIACVATSTGEAFHIGNPLKAVGNVVGGVLHGVGGVLGQGLAGFAAPTIDDAGNRMQQVAENAISAADAAAGRRIDQISEKLTSAIVQADDVVTKHIQEIDDIITKKLGVVDVIGTKQINNLEQAMTEIVRYTSMLFLISGCLFVIFTVVVKRLASNHFNILATPQLLSGCTLLITISLIGLLASILTSPPSATRMMALSENLRRSYQYSMELGDLSGATFYASQLNALDSSNFANRLLVDVSDLQRDALMRPALFKTPKGILELSARLGRINRTWDLVQESKIDTTPLSFLEYELPATTALILWQTSRTESDEISAACSALTALASFKGVSTDPSAMAVKPENASPYVWLAYTYVKWAKARSPSGDKDCGGKTVSSYLGELEKTISAFDAARPNPLVDHIVTYDRAAIDYYAIASRSYAAMIVNDVQFRFKTVPTDKSFFKGERDKTADMIVTAWNSFVATAKAEPALQGNNLLLTTTGMPAAIALRAATLKGQDGRPAFDVVNCNNVVGQLSAADPQARNAASNTPLGELLNLLDPGVRNAACADQSFWDSKFVQFEAALSDTYGAGKTPAVEKANMLKKSEFSNIASSIVACIVVNDLALGGTIGGDRSCQGNEYSTQTRTLADWMKSGYTYDPSQATRVSFIR